MTKGFCNYKFAKVKKNGEKYLKTSLCCKWRSIRRCIGNISGSCKPQNTNLIS